MAGNDSTGNFNADTFRQQIQATMLMGQPNETQYQTTFRWVVKPEYAITDPASRPYNWFSPVATGSPTTPSDFTMANCAVEILTGTESGTGAGFINEIQAKLTILDTDMASILTHGGGLQPDQVLIKGNIYDIHYVTLEALFSVDVYTLHCASQAAA